MSRIFEYLRHKCHDMAHRLMQIRDTPHAIAGGVAIGFVCGCTPLWSLKTLLAIVLAWLCRCSKISAVLAVTLHDILLPIWPVVVWWQYKIGVFLISHPHRFPPELALKHFKFEHLTSFMALWSFKTVRTLVWPTLIGSLITALPVAGVLYLLVLDIVSRAQAVRARHAAHEEGNASK